MCHVVFTMSVINEAAGCFFRINHNKKNLSINAEL